MMKRDRVVQRWLDRAADRLNLGGWAIHFDPIPCDGDEEASVLTSETQHAYIRVSKRFWDFTPEYQRHVLTHELCHLYTTRIREFCESLHTCMSKKSALLAEDLLTKAEEHAVENFARIAAPLLPLIGEE